MAAEDPRVAHLRLAWPALVRGARTAQLYNVSHSLVQKLVSDAASRLRAAVGAGGPVRVEFDGGHVFVEGFDLSPPDQALDPLVVRMVQEGIRAIEFRATLDIASLLRLVDRLAPLAGADIPVGQASVSRLRMEPLDGVRVEFDDGSADAELPEADADRAGDWARWFAEPAASDAPLVDDALVPVWDGSGGVVPWPVVFDPADVELLGDQAAVVAEEGATLARIGMILPDAIRYGARDGLDRPLLDRVASVVGAALDADRIADAASVLQPLARWTDGEGEGVAAGAREVLSTLMDERTTARILGALQAERVRGQEVLDWFLLHGPHAVPRLFELAAAGQRGAARDVVMTAIRDLAGPDRLGLAEALQYGSLGAALGALELLAPEPLDRLAVRLLVAGLDRPEPAARTRALRLLLTVRTAVIGRRVVPWVAESNRELRSAALAWVAEHRWAEAAVPLRAFVTATAFEHLSVAERTEAARTYGLVGAADALTVALLKLGGAWEVEDPAHSLPWVACLAATGDSEAEVVLSIWQRIAGARGRATAADLEDLWQTERQHLAVEGRGGA